MTDDYDLKHHLRYAEVTLTSFSFAKNRIDPDNILQSLLVHV